MKLDEMLREVFSKRDANGDCKTESYTNADKKFCKLLSNYELENIFQTIPNSNEYTFTEKDIQLLKFIRELDSINPVKRSNVSPEKLTLENFNKVANTVKNAINNNKYPAITDDLKSSLRTPEFLSLYFLHNLVKKITLLLQYVCQNSYSDFEIYNQVNEYLDMLLYPYAGHEHYSDFMNKGYYEPLGIKMPHGYDNKIEFNDISIYEGVKKYVQNVFYAVTKGDGKSKSIEADIVQGEYRYVFEFDSIEEVEDFIGEYCKYFDVSYKFKKYCNHNLIRKEIFHNEELPTKYIEFASSLCLCNEIMNKITNFLHIDKKEKQTQVNYINGKIENDIKLMRKYTKFDGGMRNEFKKRCNKLRKAQDNFINKYMYTYGNGKLLRAIGFINTLKKEIFGSIKNDFEFEIIETLFYDGLILPWYNSMQSKVGSNPIEFQLSYKSFKIQLSNIDFIKFQNKEISNEDIIKGISETLKKTDNQITSDFENDNDLYSDISKAVGNYLFKIFEQSETNKPKKKSK